MAVTKEDIMALREKTGAGIMDTKRALEETNGNVAKAEEILRERAMKVAVKKAERTTGQGLVETYIHGNGRIGAMVEVNCETDFVARTEQFRTLVHDIAMQVAAMDPQYVGDEPDAPPTTPETGENRLLYQAFIKNPSKTIKELVTDTVGAVGENIRIRRFARFQVGA